MEDRRHRPAHGFWGRVADLVVAQPLPILSVCLLVLLPLAVVGARTVSSYSQLSDLDPDTPSVDRHRHRQAVFRRRRIEPGGRAGPPPAARLPIAAGPPGHRRVKPQAAFDREHRRGSLAHPAAGQAALRRARQRILQSIHRPGRRHGRRVALRRHPARRPPPTATTSPASTSSSRPTHSPKPAFMRSKKCRTRLRAAARPGEPLAGATSIGIAGSSSMLHDLKSVTGAGPAQDVLPGHDRRLC